MADPQLYIHIGMHKTGTTYFQKQILPYIKGATYISRAHINRFLGLDRDKKYVISNESLSGWAWGADRRLFIEDLAHMFPYANIMMCFREPEDWLASVYNEYVKWGGTLPVDMFLDLENDQGIIKQSELYFSELLNAVLENFENKPYVFLYKELREDPEKLFANIEKYMGCKFKLGDSKNKKRNVGLTARQISFLQMINGISRSEFNPDGKLRLRNRYFKKVGLDPVSLTKKLRPFLKSGTIRVMHPEFFKLIENKYANDWEKITDYVKRSRT